MIARKTAKRALGLVWEAMVELAEGGHDEAVSTQRGATTFDAERIATRAHDLSALALAAAVLARSLDGGTP